MADDTEAATIKLDSETRQGVERPVLHVLLPDGRTEVFRSKAIVIPEASDNPADGQVFALLINGDGTPYQTAEGEPVILDVPAVTLSMTERDDTALSYREVADRAGVSVSSVKRAVYEGSLPMPQLVGRRSVRFKLGDVQDWLQRAKRPARKKAG